MPDVRQVGAELGGLVFRVKQEEFGEMILRLVRLGDGQKGKGRLALGQPVVGGQLNAQAPFQRRDDVAAKLVDEFILERFDRRVLP